MIDKFGIGDIDRVVKLFLGIDRTRLVIAAKVVHEDVQEKHGIEIADKFLEEIFVAFHREETHRRREKERESRRELNLHLEAAGVASLPLTKGNETAGPPGLSRTEGTYWIVDHTRDELQTAYDVLNTAARGYRYRMRLRHGVEKDLLRWAAIFGGRVYFHVCKGRPVAAFERLLVTGWLAAGGKAWIIAELDKRSAGRVVAFRGRP